MSFVEKTNWVRAKNGIRYKHIRLRYIKIASSFNDTLQTFQPHLLIESHEFLFIRKLAFSLSPTLKKLVKFFSQPSLFHSWIIYLYTQWCDIVYTDNLHGLLSQKLISGSYEDIKLLKSSAYCFVAEASKSYSQSGSVVR